MLVYLTLLSLSLAGRGPTVNLPASRGCSTTNGQFSCTSSFSWDDVIDQVDDVHKDDAGYRAKWGKVKFSSSSDSKVKFGRDASLYPGESCGAASVMAQFSGENSWDKVTACCSSRYVNCGGCTSDPACFFCSSQEGGQPAGDGLCLAAAGDGELCYKGSFSTLGMHMGGIPIFQPDVCAIHPNLAERSACFRDHGADCTSCSADPDCGFCYAPFAGQGMCARKSMRGGATGLCNEKAAEFFDDNRPEQCPCQTRLSGEADCTGDCAFCPPETYNPAPSADLNQSPAGSPQAGTDGLCVPTSFEFKDENLRESGSLVGGTCDAANTLLGGSTSRARPHFPALSFSSTWGVPEEEYIDPAALRDTESSEGAGLSTAAIAGIVAGIVLVLCGVCVCLAFVAGILYRGRTSKTHRHSRSRATSRARTRAGTRHL
jgi:hypothetical protein